MGWSKEIKEKTRKNAGDGAMLKNEQADFGFYCSCEDGIKILGIKTGSILPMPSDEVIATFKDINAMIDAGWVID